MTGMRSLALAAAIAGGALLCDGAAEEARAAFRQYYSGWSHAPERGYFYRKYHYKPDAAGSRYEYHYCIYYPSDPRYVYYYDPETQVYWGRFDTQGEPGRQYSLLPSGLQSTKLSDVPDEAFPPPGDMPVIPGAADGVRIEPPQGLPAER
ncbi:MAG: hypothetical protein ACREJB_11220 [Planctomycetaceae bacterium]